MPRLPRRSTLITIVLAVAVSLVVTGSVGGSSQAAQKAGLGVRMDHIPAPNQVIHYPTNAGTVFKWGVPKWTDEFEVNPLRKDWVASRQGKVKTQSGMLTVIGTGKQTKITASPNSVKARYGRWEARVRIRETNHNGERYRAYWELIPTGSFKCGAKSIVLASYKSQDKKVTGAVRVPPEGQYSYKKKLPLHQGWFHTYAIEITKKHISWFVDTKVIHTERRDDALRGIRYRPRFRLQGKEKTKHRTTWLQMDWVRHYDLSRKNAKSIKAPRMRKGEFKDPC